MKKYLLNGFYALLLTIGSTYAVNAQQVNEEELKINVTKIANSTAQLQNLEPIAFNYDTDKFKNLDLPNGNQYGFMASNIETTFPGMVQTSSKIYISGKNNAKVAKFSEVDQESLIPMLVAAIKEQQEQIEALKQEIEALKAK